MTLSELRRAFLTASTAQRNLAQRHHELSQLLGVMSTVSSTLQQETLLTIILSKLREVVPYERIALMEFATPTTLKIITGRPAWPWQDEMIAIMLHKPNVWAELHGWSPRYLTEPLRHEVTRRLRKRIMFGADYPLFRYERLVADWRALGYDDETLARVLHGNAEALFGLTPPAGS